MDEGFKFHHVGIAVRNMQHGIENYKELFNYTLISGPFDDPIQKVSVCFLSRGDGDTVLELVSPLGPDSPIRRVLKKGGGTYHLCYQVPLMDAAIAHMLAKGSILISDPVPAVAFEMRSIAWLMTETDLLVELLQA